MDDACRVKSGELTLIITMHLVRRIDSHPRTWHGRVVIKKPEFIENYIPLYFKTNDTLERFLKVPATAEDADLMLDFQNPPYLEADMPPVGNSILFCCETTGSMYTSGEL